MNTPRDRLRHAPVELVPGSVRDRVTISRADAKALLKEATSRSARKVLRRLLENQEGPEVRVWTDDRTIILSEGVTA